MKVCVIRGIKIMKKLRQRKDVKNNVSAFVGVIFIGYFVSHTFINMFCYSIFNLFYSAVLKFWKELAMKHEKMLNCKRKARRNN